MMLWGIYQLYLWCLLIGFQGLTLIRILDLSLSSRRGLSEWEVHIVVVSVLIKYYGLAGVEAHRFLLVFQVLYQPCLLIYDRILL